MPARNFSGRLAPLVVGTALLLPLSGCIFRRSPPADNTLAQQQPDRWLYERGMAELERKRWIRAREHFRALVDTYPTSLHRQDAKLGIGDSFFGEKSADSDVLAASEYREFLRYFPFAPRADYAQFKLAQTQIRQVLKPERDQTPTRDALRELQTFMTTYPDSKYLPEVTELYRQMRDRLSDSEMVVARYYFKVRHYLGTISRLEELMKVDPGYTNRDGMYYLLGETYYRVGRKGEAKVLFDRLLSEFKESDYLDDAKKRAEELVGESVPLNAEIPASTAPATAATPAQPAPAPASSSTPQTATPTAR
jgi:outer membrane protein assembly factor BamD